jgi:hypothetical protein
MHQHIGVVMSRGLGKWERLILEKLPDDGSKVWLNRFMMEIAEQVPEGVSGYGRFRHADHYVVSPANRAIMSLERKGLIHRYKQGNVAKQISKVVEGVPIIDGVRTLPEEEQKEYWLTQLRMVNQSIKDKQELRSLILQKLLKFGMDWEELLKESIGEDDEEERTNED